MRAHPIIWGGLVVFDIVVVDIVVGGLIVVTLHIGFGFGH